MAISRATTKPFREPGICTSVNTVATLVGRDATIMLDGDHLQLTPIVAHN